MPARDWLDLAQLAAHSLDMRQFINFQESTLPDGSRIITAHNSSGLSFTLLPDRGLDIWQASYNGVPLTWLSPGSPHPPDFGQDWLRQFNGGLLTTCGLTHVGPPETDLITGQPRDIHGRYSRLRAHKVHVAHPGLPLDAAGAEGEPTSITPAQMVAIVSAEISEGALFGEQLLMQRSIQLALGEPTITIDDRVTNLSRDQMAPFMLLYHFNFGYPLVREGARLKVAHHAVYPRDAEAAFGFEQWEQYEAASACYDEQVFFHHPLTGEDHIARTALINDDFGVELAWDTRALPYLTQWKNTRSGIYVSGIEPGNCIPEGQNAARIARRLVMLEPGETRRFQVQLSVLDGVDDITAAQMRIGALAVTGQTAPNCRLDDYARFKNPTPSR